jgi:Ser/Thr protein kinase RdoA (MazF antagonist)
MAGNSIEPNPLLASEILTRHWRISDRPLRTNLGVSRATWRIGREYWLSQSDESRSPLLIRQGEMLRQLHCFLRDERTPISVPEIVPNLGGELVFNDHGYGWSLTRHIEGFHPECGDPEIYPMLVGGLAQFHRALRMFSERQPADVAQGVNTKTRQNMERLSLRTFIPFTCYAKEEKVLIQAAEWLLPRLTHFEGLPKQLVHGDWTPQNVLFGFRNHKALLTAVLDFEEIGMGPVHVDVGNVCSTLLMWSGLPGREQRIQDVLRCYETFSSNRLEPEDIHTGMLAHWFCHYWKWRDRIESGGWGNDVKERLCLRIASVLDYLNRASTR